VAWTVADIPDLTGKTIIVTGANSGIGWEASRLMAARGAHVVMAARNADKAQVALEALSAAVPEASVAVMSLDLADLASVNAFADAVLERCERVDVLVNNAGVMAIPRSETKDGFEMQLGVNHLGHFALTARLFTKLKASGPSRVVNVSSMAHTMGEIYFDDLMGEQTYKKWKRYGQSKLANLLFTYELDRRLKAAGVADVAVTACHPGYAATNLQFVGAQQQGSRFKEKMMAFGNALLAQSAEMGALPTVYAAVAPEAASGDYIGPKGWMGGMRGYPTKVKSNDRSHDEVAAAKLWEVSEALTGVPFGVA
jgi:NAD(P)-dependent dehydrogenase (short-subunit alcohol dehydrogenase family)